MALENFLSAGANSADLLEMVGSIGLWLQAIGVVVVLWIALNIANWFMNRKRLKEVYKIKEDMQRIENKLDEILKK